MPIQLPNDLPPPVYPKVREDLQLGLAPLAATPVERAEDAPPARQLAV